MGNNQSKKVSNNHFVRRKYKKADRLHNTTDYNMKLKSYAIQGEFGEKKFIKPWRTGTKSQQQIPPRGQRKGFRGKTQSSK